MKLIVFILFILCFSACSTTNRTFYKDSAKNWQSSNTESLKELVHTLYLVGDGGDIDDPTQGNFVMDAVKHKISKEDENTSLVFLGDNIYPAGMPKKDDPTRALSEAIIKSQLQLATEFPGKTYFIPGNHDWNRMSKGGLKAMKRQEKFIEDYFKGDDPKVRMYPSNGCADPKVVIIHKDLAFVFIDTQWWLQDWDKEKNINRGCEIKSKSDFLNSMEEILTDHKNDEVVILMHHPIHSDGTHGGYFPLKDHLFPLSNLKNLYIPLPIIGSLYPLMRKSGIAKQDIPNMRNREIMQGINDIALHLRMNVLFASGHDHNLQYFDFGNLKHIVSGSAAKTDFVKKGEKATFATESRGYVKVEFYEDFEVWADFYRVSDFAKDVELLFRTQIREPRAGTMDEEITYGPITKTDTIVAANPTFAAGAFKKAFLGKQYRDTWRTPVKAEMIDLTTKHGGLTPIKKGGGMASNSLRMEKENGQQYILRSINKDYTKLVPPQFGNLKLLDLMKDQNSASHPYGALVIPKLSQAAGVYYTNPKLAYLKHQPGLDNYNSQFPEELYLLEERPSGNWSNAAQFGNSSKIIGYTDLLVNLREKKTHIVDQSWVLKSRLFDLWIHDWDRHDDQWRWASFEEDDKTIYRPIPRDRDQAFYKFVGVVPSYISGFLIKQFKTMKDDLKAVKHAAFNARHFDRYFLNELEWSDWERVIAQLQRDISDQDIEDAMTALPEEVMNLSAVELSRKLKSRRNQLRDIGRKHFLFINKEVEITGTDDDDRFEIEHMANGHMKIKVFAIRKTKGDLLKYDRNFDPKISKEVRLYGLRGKDEFKITGVDKSSIRLRIIGGEDDDTISNESGSKMFAYDDLDGIKMDGSGIVNKTSSDLDVNEYDRNEFQYNTNFPYLTFGHTVDDGFWFGAGMNWMNQGWRKSPYKSSHKFSFRVAPGGRNSVIANYDGHFPNAIGMVDFAPSFGILSPHYENYFGLGNESVNEKRDIQYNWVRLQSYYAAPLWKITSDNRLLDFTFGPSYWSHDIKNSESRIATDDVLGFSDEDFQRKDFIGLQASIDAELVDNKVFPTGGAVFNSSIHFMNGLNHDDYVLDFKTELSLYVRLLVKPQLVLANSVGFNKVIGDPQFYQTADLGNTTSLRGFRENRFRGDSAFYHNIDLRLFLFKWDNVFLPMDVGVLGGFDYGRVWLNGEQSDTWHNSRTIGVWMELLGLAVLQPHYSFTEEGNVFALRLGFNF
jgi:hypothetical protein